MRGTEMKGIERLRDWAGTLRLSGLVWAEEMADELESTVDLIRREHAEDCCRMGLDYGAVSRVVTDMERHVSGAEGAEDSPVARWSRELREALTSNEVEKVKCGHADDVSMSAYDLLSEEERDAIAWVREHGGIEAVKETWNRRSNLDRQLERAQAKVERQQRHIEAVQRKCRERQHHIAELNKMVAEMRPRLMPEGMEWPRYESGEMVQIGDDVIERFIDDPIKVRSIEFRDGYTFLREVYKTDRIILVHPGERVKRPAPKVLDADGAEIREGETVYGTGREQHEYVVRDLCKRGSGFGRFSILCHDVTDDKDCFCDPSQLTHERPDSWERIEEDADALAEAEINGEGSCNAANAYCNRRGLGEGTSFVLMAQDLVRRCKALAERGQ